MNTVVKLKRSLLFIGDLLALYLALFLTLLIRYGEVGGEIAALHVRPFSFMFVLWILIFYIADLYDLRVVKDSVDTMRRFVTMLFVNGIIAISFFYFIPGLPIAPKTNLFLFLGLVTILDYNWRRFYARTITVKLPTNKLLLIGYNQTMRELADYLSLHPQLGYEIKFWMKEGMHDKQLKDLAHLIAHHHVNTIVVPAHIKKNSRAARLIYKNLVLGTEVVDLSTLYERVFKKVPLAELEDVWFLENIARSHTLYDMLKRPFELVVAFFLFLVGLPFALVATFLNLFAFKRDLFFSQRRVGLLEKEFYLYKFRTMRLDAEQHGPQWAVKDDARTTRVGKFLRRTHLDEFPQLWNVIKGTLSLIGPRPERPEFVELLKKEIPYYELRHLIRPGITGWAQTHYRYGASIEDAYEKLQYDIYYLKHRSFFLDVLILLKTIKFFFTNL